MKITDKQLFNLPVYTTIEQFVGYVVGYEIEVEAHTIQCYYISKHKLVARLTDVNALLVHPNQVVTITAERMTVKDGLVNEEDTVLPVQPMPSTPSSASLQQTTE